MLLLALPLLCASALSGDEQDSDRSLEPALTPTTPREEPAPDLAGRQDEAPDSPLDLEVWRALELERRRTPASSHAARWHAGNQMDWIEKKKVGVCACAPRGDKSDTPRRPLQQPWAG